MRTAKSLLLYITGLGSNLVTAAILLVLWAVWGTGLRFYKKPGTDSDGRPFPGDWILSCEVKRGSLKMYKYGGTTIGPHVVYYREGMPNHDGWSRIQEHESVHCEQLQSASLVSTLLAALYVLQGGFVVVALCLWAALPFAIVLSSFPLAWLRGEDTYRGAHTEKAAYARAADEPVTTDDYSLGS